MAKTILDLTPEEQQVYRPLTAITERRKSSYKQTEERWQQARQVALAATQLLRQEFGANKVLLFGSTVHRSWFTPWSDIDLAVWGIAPDRFFAAVAAVTRLSSDFQIDLIDPESCSPTLLLAINQDGIEL